jgi:hypothetical protein
MRPTTASRPPEERDPQASFCLLLASLVGAFALAAVAAALVRSRQPFDHGWWLVAYLALVGGLSPVILGVGQFKLGAAPPRQGLLACELILWNLGAVLVPVGVFAGVPGVVAAGSVLLLAALALFATVTRVPARPRSTPERFRLHAYRTIVIFLAGSVMVGTGLADALPGQ